MQQANELPDNMSSLSLVHFLDRALADLDLDAATGGPPSDEAEWRELRREMEGGRSADQEQVVQRQSGLPYVPSIEVADLAVLHVPSPPPPRRPCSAAERQG